MHFEFTSISRIADEVDHDLLLIDDVEHGEVICERVSSFAEHRVSYIMADVARRSFIRVQFATPWTSKTRSETLEEAKRSPQVTSSPALLTITTNGGEWRSVDQEEREWQRMRQLRYSIRPTVSFFLLEAAERMRGTVFATTEASIWYEMVGRYLVYEPQQRSSLQLEQVPGPPACDFDEAFGYPCSKEQLARIKAATEAGKTLHHY